jgi:hypothetical protein
MAEGVTLRVAILDDNAVLAQLQELLILRRFPNARVTVSNEPKVLPGYDVYLIDNRFGQRELALDLCAQTRGVAPEALIIVWSAHVTKELLKELSRVGINAVAEKGNQADLEAALAVMQSFADRGRKTGSFGATIRSIRDLLAQWNTRLTDDEKEASLS